MHETDEKDCAVEMMARPGMAETLLDWGERLLDARTLEEVFRW